MTLKKRPGSRYWYARTKINGKTFERSTGTSDNRKAQIWHDNEFQRLVQLLRNSPDASLELGAAIVREVARVEADVSAREAVRGGQALMNFQQWAATKTLDQITTREPEEYQRYRKSRRRGQKQTPVGVRTIRMEINYILRLLRLNGFQVARPFPIKGRVTPNRAFTQDELRIFFRACPPEWYTLFLTLLCTGARPAELIPSKLSSHVPLLKSEVNEEAGTVTIRSAKSGGLHLTRRRVMPVDSDLMQRIVAQAGQTKGQHVFTAPGAGLNHLFDRILQDAGIEKTNPLGEKLTAHSSRQTFATLYHQSVGGDLSLLRRALGHTQITTTQIYDHYEGPRLVIDSGEVMPGPELLAEGE